jgi:CRISPR/Cas system CMR subunit Cmr4 (Cas7 group RAMP superfamily)
MTVEWFILRATLQSLSPLTIDSGEADALADTDPVRDANGLPMLPASSLAGALRAEVGVKADDWFGFQKGDKGARSAVLLTDGLFHWSDDVPRDGLVLDPVELAEMAQDTVCRYVLRGERALTRQHVRLNEQGVVDGDGKFSRDAVPTGARFTFEIRTQNREAAETLRSTVARGLTLGGATRAGYGELICVALGHEELVLPRDWDRWRAVMGQCLRTSRDIQMAAPLPAQGEGSVWTVTGQIEGPLLVGAEGRNGADRSPMREPQFIWTERVGELMRDVFLVPGSAIKGPVRHRTLYHLRMQDAETAETEIETLFGSAARGENGAAGLLRFHDAVVPEGTTCVKHTHVGLDRFTGGPRRGVLFTDEALWQPNITLRVTELQPDQITNRQRAALRAALNDLAQGVLGLGAEWGEGVGVFRDAIVTPPRGGTVDAA